MSDLPEKPLLALVVADWLARRTGHAVGPQDAVGPGVFIGDAAGESIALAVESASGSELPSSWTDALAGFTARLDCSSAGGVLLWLPAGAAPPADEPAASVAVAAVQSAFDSAEAGSSGMARVPITITIRKRDEKGAYVTAFGGLAALWAQFTDRVQGYYQIDSTQLHRLPDDETYVRDLIDRIVDASTQLQVDDAATVPAEDHWLVQRVRGGEGCVAVALPPEDASEAGGTLRKHLRTSLRTSAARLGATGATLRMLAFYTHGPSLEDEPVGTALRGQDPALFAGLDLVVVVAAGTVKPLIEITRHPLLQPGAASERA